MAALGSFAKLAKKRGWIGGGSSNAAQDTLAEKEETRSRSPSRQPHRMVRRPVSPRRVNQRQSGITGGGPQVGLSGPGMKAGEVYNPLFDEDGMLKSGAQAPPGMSVAPGVGLPTFSALPGTAGQPATSTAIVKLGIVDLTTPRKMTPPYLDQSLQKGPVCINFVAGACMNPRACGRRHPEDMQEVAHLLEILKRKPCKFGNSCQWPRCVFRHPEDGPLPDLPGYMGSKGFTGFTGFTGLVPAAGTEPGAFQTPGAGERLMVWNGAQSTSPQALPPASPATTETRQPEGSGALVAAEAEAKVVLAQDRHNGAKDRGEPPQEQKHQKESQDQHEVERHMSQIEEQQQEIERLRTMLSSVNGPPATLESQAELRPPPATEQ